MIRTPNDVTEEKTVEKVNGNHKGSASCQQTDESTISLKKNIQSRDFSKTVALKKANPIGRPKGKVYNVIGLETKTEKKKFSEKTDGQKLKLMLHWILQDEFKFESALNNGYDISLLDMESLANSNQLQHFLVLKQEDIQLLKNRFELNVFEKFNILIEDSKKLYENVCGSCMIKIIGPSITCESCMLQYDYNCAGLKRRRPKQWFCNNCEDVFTKNPKKYI